MSWNGAWLSSSDLLCCTELPKTRLDLKVAGMKAQQPLNKIRIFDISRLCETRATAGSPSVLLLLKKSSLQQQAWELAEPDTASCAARNDRTSMTSWVWGSIRSVVHPLKIPVAKWNTQAERGNGRQMLSFGSLPSTAQHFSVFSPSADRFRRH